MLFASSPGSFGVDQTVLRLMTTLPPPPLSSPLELSHYSIQKARGTDSAAGVIIIKNVKHEAITSEERRRGIDLSVGFGL